MSLVLAAAAKSISIAAVKTNNKIDIYKGVVKTKVFTASFSFFNKFSKNY